MIQFTFMSLVTSVKDYVEITHKLIEIEPLKNYTEFGAVFTYLIFSIGDVLKNIFNQNIWTASWNIPIIIPDITSAMISEVSVLDNYFHLDLIISNTSTNNFGLNLFEKFMIGVINSFFLILPTSTSHLITLRRFVMQGLEAGYMAGLGTLAGNFLWLSSIILGLRFFVIPWLSLDIFRYLLGFILLVKYIGDSSKELKYNKLEDLSKWKIFLLNFLLSLTEQSCIYPFLSNLSIGPDKTILEGFPAENFQLFLGIHGAYLLGILFGSFSLLQFSCWFWENPAFSIYLWITSKSSLKISSSLYYKILNFMFLYATMLCAITSIPYYGLDYTLTNPIGLLPQDRILDQKKSQANPDKLIIETAFLNVNPTDKNTRIRDGVHARRERWKQRLIKYQAFDAQILNKGVYDFLTIEDLNYGFDRFWLRRKMRNHQIRFRLFPGPWMRSLKKQLNSPKADPVNVEKTKSDNIEKKGLKQGKNNYIEFFRILFEQFYHPNFHTNLSLLRSSRKSTNINTRPVEALASSQQQEGLLQPSLKTTQNIATRDSTFSLNNLQGLRLNAPRFTGGVLVASPQEGTTTSQMSVWLSPQTQPNIEILKTINTNSTLRKFVRNFNTRLNLKQLKTRNKIINKYNTELIYSKRWKSFFSKTQKTLLTKIKKEPVAAAHQQEWQSYQLFRNVAKQLLLTPETTSYKAALSLKLKNSVEKLSTKERKLLNLRTKYFKDFSADETGLVRQPNTDFDFTLRPLNIYLQKEQAFKRKLRYYGPTSLRKLTVGNLAPYFKTLMKRGFYYYKPTLRWKKTLYVAKIIRGFRKKSRKQRTLVTPAAALQQQKVPGEGIQPRDINWVPRFSEDVLVASPQEGIFIKNTSTENSSINITKPTHSYSVLGKQASRYRHQIYKDVLQHWYYTPFNRLLLKFDVDAFINRQPKSHFLTKNEERLLHIRRLLLSEHYDTLRWYTYMQQYKTMKTNIGGTKSFANRVYNQQFQGTFKKIRHLFAITPKQGDFYLLKFDQPLYNDNNFSSNVYYHEELLTDSVIKNKSFIPTQSDSLLNTKIQSNTNTQILSVNTASVDSQQELQERVAAAQQQEIQNLKYIQKTKEPVAAAQQQELLPASRILKKAQNNNNSQLNMYNELFIKLIKECKKRVHDQSFLKNYISHRIEKREQLSELKIKELTKRLDLIKTWYTEIAYNMAKPVVALIPSINQNLPAATQQLQVQSNLQAARLQKTFNLKEPVAAAQQQEKLNRLKLIKELTNRPAAAQLQQKVPLIHLSKNFIQETKQLLINTSIEKISRPILKIVKTRTEKNFSWWRKKQQVMTKRKNSRKRDRFKKQISLINKKLAQIKGDISVEKTALYKDLYGSYGITDYFLTNTNPNSVKITNSRLLTQKKLELKTKSNNYFGQSNFTLRKKGSSKGRRYRSLSLARYLTATRKPRLIGLEEVTKLDNLTNLNGTFLTKQDLKTVLDLKTLNKDQSEPVATAQQQEAILGSLKKSQIKKRSRHAWKKQARQRFSLNLSKYRKRHITFNGKLRVMNKKAKKTKATNELRQWWWNSFLPRYLNKTLRKNTTEKSAIKTLNNWQSQQSLHLKNASFSESMNNRSLVESEIQIQQRQQLERIATQKLAQNINKGSVQEYEQEPVAAAQQQELLKKEKSPVSAKQDITFKPLSNSNNKLLKLENTLSTTTQAKYVLSAPSCGEATSTPPALRGALSCNPNTVLTQQLNHDNVFAKNKIHHDNEFEKIDTKLYTDSGTLPFYAGWDESLRKFVVTNRLLSRRDTGLYNNTLPILKEPVAAAQQLESQQKSTLPVDESKNRSFSNTPIRGLNEGSFLTWQTSMPFNSYNIDQFISTNQSFYAPLGWRRFEFRQLLLKTWAIKSKSHVFSNNLDNTLIISMKNLPAASVQQQQKVPSNAPHYVGGVCGEATRSCNTALNKLEAAAKLQSFQKQENINTTKAIARRIKKRNKLIQDRQKVFNYYSPTGPLLTQVLPSHYISVFDQQSRFPRNRYLKRKTLKTLEKTTLLTMLDLTKANRLPLLSNSNSWLENNGDYKNINKEFTLRKRVKPRRKYHLKRITKKDGLIFPRRTKFSRSAALKTEDDLRWRPSSKSKQKNRLVFKKEQVPKSNKRVNTNPLRLRQLRRREFQQILKPTQRFIPENGGFTWPGDYLRLEIVEMPKLKSAMQKTQEQRKINVQPVRILPRKYLIEKHNIKILKKKLEKAYDVNLLV